MTAAATTFTAARLRVHREGPVIVVEDGDESAVEIPIADLANHIRALRSAVVGATSGLTMQAMYEGGCTLLVIAREHGCAAQTVAKIARAEGWRRVKPVKGRACGCRRTGPHSSGCRLRHAAAVAERRASA